MSRKSIIEMYTKFDIVVAIIQFFINYSRKEIMCGNMVCSLKSKSKFQTLFVTVFAGTALKKWFSRIV